eukprot:626495-Alexandrium_andersonii.AAC.1
MSFLHSVPDFEETAPGTPTLRAHEKAIELLEAHHGSAPPRKIATMVWVGACGAQNWNSRKRLAETCLLYTSDAADDM